MFCEQFSFTNFLPFLLHFFFLFSFLSVVLLGSFVFTFLGYCYSIAIDHKLLWVVVIVLMGLDRMGRLYLCILLLVGVFSCPLLLVPSCLSASVRVVACRFALGCWDC